jgi:hypothetical protein
MPRSAETPNWAKPPCLRIAKVLLEAQDRTLTAPEITERGGGQNVARAASKLLEAKMLIERDPPVRAAKGPGRRVERAFHLPEDQMEAVRAAIAAQAAPAGQLTRAQQLVFADAGNLSALMEAFDVSELVARAAWFCLCDGQPQEYVIAFSGDDALTTAQAVVAELQAAGLTARRVTVAQVDDADSLAAQAQTAASVSRKARMRNAG